MSKAYDMKGSELRVGDVIDVWWKPNRDQITKLVPYDGPLKDIFPEGAQLADFAINSTGMTIENNATYKVLSRQERKPDWYFKP